MPAIDPTPAMRARRALRLVCLVLLAALATAGCRETEPEAIRFGLTVSPATLDPRQATDAVSARLLRLIYQPLVDFDEASRPEPALAEWERRSPTLYRVELRSDRDAFHDGEELTAEDVQATYASVLDRETASPHRGSLKHIERIEVIDEETLDFHLAREDGLFPGRLTLGIMPAHLLAEDHRFNRHPVGNGPFRFAAWSANDEIRLERRSDGQVVEFVEVSDPTVRTLKLIRGEIDLLQNELSPELVSYLDGQDNVQVKARPGNSFTYIGFNLEDDTSSDPRIRQAVAYGLDREAIIENLLGGRARLAGGMLPPEHWAGHTGRAGYPHDPERARQLLREAGYHPGRGPELVYKTSTDPLRLRIAAVVQDQLEAVGFRVSLRSYDWGTFYADVQEGRFQLYSLSWVGISSPDIFEYAFHSRSVPPDGANRNRYRSADVDEWIERAEQAPDMEQQAEFYRRIQARLVDDLPYVPLWYEDHFYARREGIEGYSVDADGNYDGLRYVRRSDADDE